MQKLLPLIQDKNLLLNFQFVSHENLFAEVIKNDHQSGLDLILARSFIFKFNVLQLPDALSDIEILWLC